MTRTLLTAISLTLFSQTAWAGNSINEKGLFCPCINQNGWNCESPQIFRFDAGKWNHICININQDIAVPEKCGEQEYLSSSSKIWNQWHSLDRRNLDLYFGDEKMPKWKCDRVTSSNGKFKSELQLEIKQRQAIYNAKLRDKKI